MKELEQVNNPVEVSDKEFEKLLKKYGSKTMMTFDINETLKFSKKQLKKLEELERSN